MLLVTTKFNVHPKKQKELVQAVNALVEKVRQEPGRLTSELYKDVNRENALCLLEKWTTQAGFDARLRSQNSIILAER